MDAMGNKPTLPLVRKWRMDKRKDSDAGTKSLRVHTTFTILEEQYKPKQWQCTAASSAAYCINKNITNVDKQSHINIWHNMWHVRSCFHIYDHFISQQKTYFIDHSCGHLIFHNSGLTPALAFTTSHISKKKPFHEGPLFQGVVIANCFFIINKAC